MSKLVGRLYSSVLTPVQAMSSFLSRPSTPLGQLSLSRGDLQSWAVRGLVLFLSVFIYTHLASPRPRSPTWPMSVDALNNATFGFQHIYVLSTRDSFRDGQSIYFSLPIHDGGILKPPSTPSPSRARARLPHCLILEDKTGINARARSELYSIYRALRARPLFEDMQMSDLHKLKNYWDEPDTMIPRGPQPNYLPYFRAPPTPSKDVSIDDYAFERLVTGPKLGGAKDYTTANNKLHIGEWDLIFLADCRNRFDEEAQKKLRSGANRERTPWRRIDWVPERDMTTELWYAEKTDADREIERKIRQQQRDHGTSGKDGEEELLHEQGLRRVEGMDDACLLAYAVSRRGAVKLQKWFGASDPGLGTADLFARFCGGGDGENVCFALGEGVVRERKEG
ncbi:uncharacterized protein AB675_2734 [Cyphellophora attinorum]|uniref:Uncharacterized protein n=1 Tax=Cyphellophora attinorum TaxID=1664694 RepID=A0A0N0NRG8_9EURO|nr:uncharacterized protein AB675_2734 [Phialophora attinorum]KPI44829.1 hypothetical protein AB675_2734 [Phialophora attinorum]